MCPDGSTRFENSPNGTASRPAWTLNQIFGVYSRYTCSMSMPWQPTHALAENERSSWMSTCTFSEASGLTLSGARACVASSWMPQ